MVTEAQREALETGRPWEQQHFCPPLMAPKSLLMFNPLKLELEWLGGPLSLKFPPRIMLRLPALTAHSDCRNGGVFSAPWWRETLWKNLQSLPCMSVDSGQSSRSELGTVTQNRGRPVRGSFQAKNINRMFLVRLLAFSLRPSERWHSRGFVAGISQGVSRCKQKLTCILVYFWLQWTVEEEYSIFPSRRRDLHCSVVKNGMCKTKTTNKQKYPKLIKVKRKNVLKEGKLQVEMPWGGGEDSHS